MLRDAYIIATYTGGNIGATVNHELCHAFYTLYPDYREACNSLLKKVPAEVISKTATTLLNMGYASAVLTDEMQAYFSTASGSSWRCGRKDFAVNFDNFKKNLKKGKRGV